MAHTVHCQSLPLLFLSRSEALPLEFAVIIHALPRCYAISNQFGAIMKSKLSCYTQIHPSLPCLWQSRTTITILSMPCFMQGSSLRARALNLR